MKRMVMAVALTCVLAACTSASEESPTTLDTATTDGSTSPEETVDPTTDTPSDTTEPTEPKPTDDPTDEPSEPTGPAFTTDTTVSDDFPGLTGQFLPTEARVGGHGSYDRIVVEYDGTEGSLNWSANYEATPVQDGSGFEVDMGGEEFLTLRISGVRYPEESEVIEGGIPVSGLNQSSIIDDVHVDYTFEGMHSIFIGVDEVRPYRVQVFEDPMRIVIDIQTD